MKCFLLAGLILAAVFPGTAALNPFENEVISTPRGRVDELVFAELDRRGIQPANVCSDAVFARRVWLDVTGTLPSSAEARKFILDKSPNKREALIDRLLQSDAFADYWAMKWADILRIKAEFPVNLWPNAAQAYHHWVRACLATNKPYDQFARELLTSSGSNFRVGPVNFYRAIQNRTPEGIASAVALTFMGVRTDAWPSNRLAGMTPFFAQIGYKPTSEWKEEHVFWDPLGASKVAGNSAPGRPAVAAIGQASNRLAQPLVLPQTNTPSSEAVFPDGALIQVPPDRDPREVFTEWLVNPKNPWFTRCAANRVWAWLVGRGIVHEPDDFRGNNPPSHPELLAYLEKELAASGYDLKHLYRLILSSSTYQFSAIGKSTEPEAEACFASYPLRRLDAEVLIDAINQISGTSDLYTSPIPEPFTYIPEDKPAVAIGDGSITSPFLTLFGRSARATGMENERNNKLLPAQWLHLLNSSHIQRKLDQSPKLKALFDSRRKPREMFEELFLTVLSRFPTPEEIRTAATYGVLQAADKPGKPAAPKRREDWVDITWALLCSTEFLYRH